MFLASAQLQTPDDPIHLQPPDDLDSRDGPRGRVGERKGSVDRWTPNSSTACAGRWATSRTRSSASGSTLVRLSSSIPTPPGTCAEPSTGSVTSAVTGPPAPGVVAPSGRAVEAALRCAE